MNIEDINQQLQTFADANNLNVDVSRIMDIISAGDFVALNSAMDNSDNTQIVKILQKYRAQVSESYSQFGNHIKAMLVKDEMFHEVRNMGISELTEHYRHCNGSTFDNSFLTLQEMRTLVYEDLTTSLNSSTLDNKTTQAPQDGQQNPVVAAKLKQQEIQRNSGNQNFKVTVPGVNGSSAVQDVLGVDIGNSPDKSLVVTKDPSKQGEVQVFSMNDVSTVNEEEEDEIQQVMVQPQEMAEPEIEVDVIGSEPEIMAAPEDTEAEQDAIVQQIVNFCKKLGM